MLRVGRRTVGLRFTVLYAGVFMLSGAALLALTFLLSGGVELSSTAPVEQQPPPPSDAAQQQIRALQEQLADVNDRYSRQLLIGSLLALVVMAVVSVVLGRALAVRVLRPLRLITASTRRISADNLDQRLAVAGPADEVKDLADTIDGVLERLEASFTAQRRFVANASHELRTPLATIRASLDVAVAKPSPSVQVVTLAERIRTQLDRVDELLDGFLVLARAQHGAQENAQPDPEPVDCGALLSSAVAVAPKDLEVRLDLDEDVWTRGNPALLTRMVENVVDNAVRHNEDGGWVRIAASREGSEVRLVVENGGPVLVQADVDRLARPFQRLGSDRVGSEDGSGLGLSIVAAIAEAHGGRLVLVARDDGGLRTEIRLPAVSG
jgi:signal transduction histidine kinase